MEDGCAPEVIEPGDLEPIEPGGEIPPPVDSQDAGHEQPVDGVPDSGLAPDPTRHPQQTCDEASPPDDALFVSPTSGSDDDPGTARSPFRTLGPAVRAAAARDEPTVIIVGEGTLLEPLRLIRTQSPLGLQGGWAWTEGTWQRRCDAAARARTRLVTSTSTAVLVHDAGGLLTLETLTIETKDPCGIDAAGVAESCVGVYVSDSDVRLVDADVQSGRGGDGVPGAPGSPSDTLTCDRVNDCSETPVSGSNGQTGMTEGACSRSEVSCRVGVATEGRGYPEAPGRPAVGLYAARGLVLTGAERVRWGFARATRCSVNCFPGALESVGAEGVGALPWPCLRREALVSRCTPRGSNRPMAVVEPPAEAAGPGVWAGRARPANPISAVAFRPTDAESFMTARASVPPVRSPKT